MVVISLHSEKRQPGIGNLYSTNNDYFIENINIGDGKKVGDIIYGRHGIFVDCMICISNIT